MMECVWSVSYPSLASEGFLFLTDHSSGIGDSSSGFGWVGRTYERPTMLDLLDGVVQSVMMGERNFAGWSTGSKKKVAGRMLSTEAHAMVRVTVSTGMCDKSI